MRAEFSRKTRRLALARAGDGDPLLASCEATGAVYGHPEGHRCGWPLSNGVEFDHYPVRAADGGSNDLDNCVAVCPTCHRYKTSTFDTPMAAKGKRVSDRHLGLRKQSTFQSRGFPKAEPQKSATRKTEKWSLV